MKLVAGFNTGFFLLGVGRSVDWISGQDIVICMFRSIFVVVFVFWCFNVSICISRPKKSC